MYLSDPAAPVCPEQKDLFVYSVSQVVACRSAFVGKSPFDDARANAVFWHNKTKTKAINAEKTKCRDRL